MYSKFEQAKALYFYILGVYITEPVAMVCLDVSNLRQALNAIKEINGKAACLT